MLLMQSARCGHPILIPVIRLAPVAEEDGGRDAQCDKEDADHGTRHDAAAARVNAAPLKCTASLGTDCYM